MICHSKTYWASINRKPPLKEFKLPDLFSDNGEPETGILTENICPEKLTLTDTCIDKDISHNSYKGVVVNTEKPNTETPMTSQSAASDTPSKRLNSTDICSINTEKTGEVTQIEPEGTRIEKDSDNSLNKDSVSAENGAVNTETDATNSEMENNDKETYR